MSAPSRRAKEKQIREADIISAEQKLFSQKGFENVSMDQIASEAQFTKRTLYQYFSSKQDLYFAIVLQGFQQLFAYCEEAVKKGGNGIEKLKLSFMAYYRFYRDFPETFHLMNYLGHVKKKSSPKQKEWIKFDDYMFQALASIIELGKADGSLRKDLESVKTTHAMAFILTGFFHELSETGATFSGHFNLDEEQFALFALELLLESLKAKK